MKKYKVELICYDCDNSNGIDYYSKHEKEISEEIFNSLYKLIC